MLWGRRTGPSAEKSTRRSEACATARGRTPSHALTRAPVKRGWRRLSRRSCGGCRWPRPNERRADRSVRTAHAMEARGTGRTGGSRPAGRASFRREKKQSFLSSELDDGSSGLQSALLYDAIDPAVRAGFGLGLEFGFQKFRRHNPRSAPPLRKMFQRYRRRTGGHAAPPGDDPSIS